MRDCSRYALTLSGPSTVIIPANGISSGVLISVRYNDDMYADNVTGLTANDFTFELTDGCASTGQRCSGYWGFSD